jgi:hypothetical protein
MPQTYLPDDTYHALVAALMQAPHRFDTESAIVQALGDVGGVWPVSVKDDPHFE